MKPIAKSSSRAKLHPAGAAPRVGSLRAASRWVVEHSGLTTLFLVLLVSALCVGQWWWSYRQAQRWEANHPHQPFPFHLFDAVGWALVIGAAGWLGLWTLSGKESETPSLSAGGDGWRFDQRERQRIFEGRPISGRVLWMHGLFGLAGLALGVGVALRLAAGAGWQVEFLSERQGPLGLVVLAIVVMAFAARRIHDVLFLQHFDSLVGDRAKELAQAVAEEEQAAAEAEREYERKRITGLPYLVFMGGFIGGLFLANKLLPGTEATMASQGSLSGLIASVAVVYQRRLKPRRGTFWMAVALLVAVGLLVFTCATWPRPVWYALLGVPWGIMVGLASTLLYVRQLRGS